MFTVDDYEMFRCFEREVGGIHLWNVSFQCRFDGHPVTHIGSIYPTFGAENIPCVDPRVMLCH